VANLPALSVLIAFVLITAIILFRLSPSQLANLTQGSNALMFVVAALFAAILVVHLFIHETWTADVLKLLGGALVGAAATKGAEKASKSSGGVSVAGSSVENSNIVGRDYFNQVIEKLEAEVANVRDAVIKQSTTFQQFMESDSSASSTEYLINTVYERQERVAEGVERVLRRWTGEGWKLVSMTSDYQGMDGVMLLFSRPADAQTPRPTRYYHGSQGKP
jgi:hypothetical protein